MILEHHAWSSRIHLHVNNIIFMLFYSDKYSFIFPFIVTNILVKIKYYKIYLPCKEYMM